MKKKLRSILALGLTLVLLTGSFAMFAYAADKFTDGIYTYTVANGKATVVSVDESVTGDIVLPATLGTEKYPLSYITEGAFWKCTGITSVTFSSYISFMEAAKFDRTFSGMTGIKTVNYPNFNDAVDAKLTAQSLTRETASTEQLAAAKKDALDEIGKYLASISRNVGLTNADTYTVAADSELIKAVDGVIYSLDGTQLIAVPIAKANVTVPEGVTSLGQAAFYSGFGIKTVVLPATLTEIGEHCFSFSSVESVDFSKCTALKSIREAAFQYCLHLTAIDLSACTALESVDENAFGACIRCETLKMPQKHLTLGSDAFADMMAVKTLTAYQTFNSSSRDKAAPGLLPAFKDGSTRTKAEYVTAYADYMDAVIESEKLLFATQDSLETIQSNADAKLQALLSILGECDMSKPYVAADGMTVTVHAGTVLAAQYAAAGVTCTLLDHTVRTVREAVANTCTTDGSTAELYCETCDFTIQESEVIYASHTDTDGDDICEVCGQNIAPAITLGQDYSGTLAAGRTEYYSYTPAADMNLAITFRGKDDYAGYFCFSNSKFAEYSWAIQTSEYTISQALTAGTKYYLFFENTTSSPIAYTFYAGDEDCQHTHTIETEAAAATCNSPGYTAGTRCTDCGSYITGHDITGDVDPANHTGETEVRDAKAATCTEAGYTGDTYCKGCGVLLTKGEAVPVADHNWGEWTVTTAATCTAEGTETRTCSVGGETETRTIAVDPANHAGYGTHVVNAKEATDSQDGYTGDTVCDGCGAVINAGSVIPKTGTDNGGKISFWAKIVAFFRMIADFFSHLFKK